MDNPKNQLVDKLKTANNVLVTVSRDPSVDQLSALLGLTLLLNKLDKHAAAVYSGRTPSTIEFLKPDATIEKNTDSLRDFIIALDKTKADKLRYKVENDVVRIFITPYKTSITEADLDFSQGDFNVDLVVTLGVRLQEDLDQAITAHGRILHDATVASILTISEGSELGTIVWQEPQASSLSELVTELAQALAPEQIDTQIATALLTGIVAETDRFSNSKTTAQTMSASAALMTSGADQQLVATKLGESEVPPVIENNNEQPEQSLPPEEAPHDEPKLEDGVIEIEHTGGSPEPTVDAETEVEAPIEDISLPEPSLEAKPEPEVEPAAELQNAISSGSKLITEPPTLGGTLTANSKVEDLAPAINPLQPPDGDGAQLKTRSEPLPVPAPTPEAVETPAPVSVPAPDLVPFDLSAPPTETPPPASEASTETPATTLSDLESSVQSPHIETASLDDARDEVSRALSEASKDTPPPPVVALNAQPLGPRLHSNEVTPLGPNDEIPQIDPALLNDDPTVVDPSAAPAPEVVDPNAPPPVPPPIPFNFGGTGTPPAAT